MADTFQPGDLVQLKSGGPVMTVGEISNHGTWAVWFAYGKHHRCHFGIYSLQAASIPAEKPGK